MDLLEQGKQLTQQGNYEEALNSLYLALENDKENADVHFYIGLCYSSLEQFEYAKYHYQTALALNPNHGKTKLMWDSIKNYEAQRPPERKNIRAAAAKARRVQPQEPEPVIGQPEMEHSAAEQGYPTFDQTDSSSKYKVTDAKWEQAFPMEKMEPSSEGMGTGTKLVLTVIALAIVVLAAYFVYLTFGTLA